MAKVKTSELIGPALDWAVQEIEYQRMVAEGEHVKQWALDDHRAGASINHYSTDWLWGGPLIDGMVREGLRLTGYKSLPTDPTSCQAQIGNIVTGGPTPLIAAMRCYVASKLGATVDIPQELLPAEL